MKNSSIHAWQHCAALAVAFSLLYAGEAIALETDYLETERLSLFSPTFVNELDVANRSTDPVVQLEAVYRRFTRPAEQLETELTFARLFGQQARFVNPAESLKWYDKALLRELPAVTLAKQLILRGNKHEQLGHHELALADYSEGCWCACSSICLITGHSATTGPARYDCHRSIPAWIRTATKRRSNTWLNASGSWITTAIMR
jgi:hypothetical protein